MGAVIMGDLLPVVIPPIALHKLTVKVDEMAEEQEIILRCNGHGVAHESAAVEG